MDAQFYLQRFTPRRAKSIWSKINIGKIGKLIAESRMQVAGLCEIEAAKVFFDTLDKTNRYAVYWRMQTAKKPETRAARIEKLVEMLAKGEKIHPSSKT